MMNKQLIKQYGGVLSIMPFLLLFLTGVSVLFAQTELYSTVAPFLSETIGFSILTNLIWLYFIIAYRYSFYAVISICTLIALNLLNILDIIFVFDYYHTYLKILLYGGIILSTYFLIKE